MFCEKCGAQLPDDAKFCERCGSSTEPGAEPSPMIAAAAAAPVAPAAPSAASLALKKFFSNKRNVIITAVVAALIVALTVVIIIIASQPEKIYIDDYFDVVFEGSDGYGYASIESSEKQREKLDKLNKKLFPEGNYRIEYLVNISLDTSDKQGQLKNGEKVKVVLKLPEDIHKYLDEEIVLRNKTVKVKGLLPVTEVNLIASAPFTFDGVNKYGNLGISSEKVEFIPGYYVQFNHSYDCLYAEIFNSENSEIASISYSVDNYYNLTNGDTITVTADQTDYDIQSLLQNHGIKIADSAHEVTVQGLREPKEFDLKSALDVKFEGYSGIGYLTFEPRSAEMTFEGYTFIFSKDSSNYRRRVYITIKNSEGDEVSYINYECDYFQNLKNGDTAVFSTDYDLEYIISQFGIILPKDISYDVTNLTEPVKPNVVNKGTISFLGVNEYGSFKYELPEANRNYTMGDYTFKLTLTEEYSYYKITVVVENASGENFLTMYYYAYFEKYLSNDSKVTFRSNISSYDITSFTETYGIYFDETFVFEVDGLKEPITTNPLDYVKFSFDEDDYGTFSTYVELTNNVYTVGNCLIQLSLSQDGGYYFINFKIKVDNMVVGSGYYYLLDHGLQNGDTIYTYFNMPDYDYVLKTYGLLVNQSSKAIIVG